MPVAYNMLPNTVFVRAEVAFVHIILTPVGMDGKVHAHVL